MFMLTNSLLILIFLAFGLSGRSDDQNMCGSSLHDPPSLELMAFDPAYPATVIIATKRLDRETESIFVKTRDGQKPGYIRSTDAGLTWSQLNSGDGFFETEDNFNAGGDISVIYRRVDSLYMRSDDGGAHWNLPKYSIDKMSPSQFASTKSGKQGKLQVALSSVDPKNAKTIVASFNIICPTDNCPTGSSLSVPGLYMSRDAGDNWFLISDKLLNGSPYAISASIPDFHVGISSTGPIKTQDGGKTWKPVGEQSDLIAAASPINEDHIRDAAKALGVQTSIVRDRAVKYSRITFSEIVLHPSEPGFILLVSSKGLYQSENNGDLWHRLEVGEHRIGFINSAAYSSIDDKIIYVGTSEYLAKSSDGGCTFRKIYPVIH
jgi:photosystem II stability/assembly factor-like uncharacterized protein